MKKNFAVANFLIVKICCGITSEIRIPFYTNNKIKIGYYINIKIIHS